MLRLALVLLPLATGCAVIDALGGDDPGQPIDPDPCPVPGAPGCEAPPQFTCDIPFVVEVDFDFGGEAFADMCGQFADEPPDSCSGGNTSDAMFELRVQVSGTYVICTDAPGDSTFTLASECRGPGDITCIPSIGCTEEFLPSGSLFLRWRASGTGPDSCGFVAFTLELIDSDAEFGPECLDGVDNDNDGFTDCEQRDCQFDPGSPCQDAGAFELCDGFDDGDTPGIPDGFVDELACHCVDDLGCDQLATNDTYLCHSDFSSDGSMFGVCGPPCGPMQPWCEQFGGVCQNGRCKL